MAAQESYPDDLSTTPSTTGRGSRTTRPSWASPGSRRTRSASSSTTSRRRPARVAKDESYGEVESVKAVSDLISPLSGEVVEVNQTVVEAPETVNEDPYGDGWLVRIRLDDPSEGRRAARRRRVPQARRERSELPLADRPDREEMLDAIGVDSIDELFHDIPAGVRFGRELDLEPPLTERSSSAPSRGARRPQRRHLARAVVPRRRDLRPLRAGGRGPVLQRGEFLTPTRRTSPR